MNAQEAPNTPTPFVFSSPEGFTLCWCILDAHLPYSPHHVKGWCCWRIAATSRTVVAPISTHSAFFKQICGRPLCEDHGSVLWPVCPPWSISAPQFEQQTEWDKVGLVLSPCKECEWIHQLWVIIKVAIWRMEPQVENFCRCVFCISGVMMVVCLG